LKESGIDKKTMIIFCSDNGPHQEGGHLVSYIDSNGEYRGMKCDLYDGGVRTPFIVRWPGVIKAGTKSSHLAAFWDVLPTFAELTGTKKTSETDGISFLPTLLGEKSKQEKHDYLYWEFFEQGGKQAIIKDNLKLVKLNIRSQTEPVIVELYNTTTDIEEQHNVADHHPDIAADMEKLLKEARTEFSVVPLFN
jgi:arylsulfatase A-like enzyme